MADDKESVKKGIKKLEELGFDELSEKDLEDVAGGAEASCSYWCCSDGGSTPAGCRGSAAAEARW